MKNKSENADFRNLWNARDDLIPVTDEAPKVIILEFDTEQVLKRISSPMLDIRAEILVHHEKDLASSHVPLPTGFCFLVSVYLPSKSPVRMLVRADSSLASSVVNFPTSLSASIVWPSVHVSLIQSKALSGLVDADMTASLVLILQLR